MATTLTSLPFAVFDIIKEYLIKFSISDIAFQQFSSWRNFLNSNKSSFFKELKHNYMVYNLNRDYSRSYIAYKQQRLSSNEPTYSWDTIETIISLVHDTNKQISLTFFSNDFMNADFLQDYGNRFQSVYALQCAFCPTILRVSPFCSIPILDLRNCEELYDLTSLEEEAGIKGKVFKDVHSNEIHARVSVLNLARCNKVEHFIKTSKNLKEVNLSSTSIFSFTTGFRSLSKLNLSYCQMLRTLSFTSSVPLKEVNISCCPLVSDLSCLKNMTIRKLDASYCPKIINVSPLKNIYHLILNYCNGITDVSSLCNVSILCLEGVVNVEKGLPTENKVKELTIDPNYWVLGGCLSSLSPCSSSKADKHLILVGGTPNSLSSYKDYCFISVINRTDFSFLTSWAVDEEQEVLTFLKKLEIQRNTRDPCFANDEDQLLQMLPKSVEELILDNFNDRTCPMETLASLMYLKKFTGKRLIFRSFSFGNFPLENVSFQEYCQMEEIHIFNKVRKFSIDCQVSSSIQPTIYLHGDEAVIEKLFAGPDQVRVVRC
jgi:hypothetical protein